MYKTGSGWAVKKMEERLITNKCPICGHDVGAYHELTFTEPYVHNNPFDGIHIYGAFSAPKETICHDNNFLHFAFYDAEGKLTDHRLVQLGVESPTTKSPSDEYMEGMEAYEDEEIRTENGEIWPFGEDDWL